MRITTLTAKKVRQDGFTIMELMIATTVLAVILLMTTIIITNIGSLYQKGVNQSIAQDSSRNIIDQISQQLQLGDKFQTQTSGNVTVYCIGNTRYSFVLGKELKNAGVGPSLWKDTIKKSTCPVNDIPAGLTAAPTAGVNGSEMLPSYGRLTLFSVVGSGSSFTVNVTVAIGDDDLLCDSSVAGQGSCSDPDTSHDHNIWNPNPPNGSVLCRSQAGHQYCATSSLSNFVASRLP